MNPYGERHTFDGYTITIYPGAERDTVDYVDYYGKERTAKINYCAWVMRLHGNAPSGTQYGSARLILPNGNRVTFRLYV